MSTHQRSRRRHAVFNLIGHCMAFGLMCFLAALVLSSGVVAAAISQGYQSDSVVSPGTLVSSQQNGSSGGKAVLADTTNAESLLGVAVSTKEATLALTSSSDGLQVATSGQVEAFVSDLTGDIKDGDAVGVSPIRGVGMKAVEAGKIAGIALGGVSYGDKTAEVKSSDGKTKQVRIGSVRLQLQVAYYTPPQDKSIVPQFLQVFVNAIAGKQVPLLQVVASAVIVLAATIAIAILMFSAVRSTMISIGRNPLAQSSIYRGLWQVIFASLMIFVAAIGSAYLVLTR